MNIHDIARWLTKYFKDTRTFVITESVIPNNKFPLYKDCTICLHEIRATTNIQYISLALSVPSSSMEMPKSVYDSFVVEVFKLIKKGI